MSPLSHAPLGIPAAARWLCDLRRRCLLLAVLGMVGPLEAGAQPAPPPSAADSQEGDADEGTGQTGGARAAPPSDVEVIRIKGHAVTGIQTEVPASVTQFTAADLQALGAQNVSDLAKVTPNVEIKTSGSTSPTFFIRGVGLSDFSANAAGAVAIYRDDVAINAPAIQLTPIYDLENVEVLRGPQGTGDNRNASAGSIKMYSRKPTGNLSSELTSSFGNFNAKNFEGAVEAPIVDEVLASRLSFRWSQRDGTAENRCGGVHTDPYQPIGRPPIPGATPFTGPDDPRLPPPPPAQTPGQPVNPGRNFGPLCNEGAVGGVVAQANPRFSGPKPPPFPNSQFDPDGDPRTVIVSRLAGLDVAKDINDLGNWAARGQLRFDPPGVDGMEWMLNVHGSRIDQLSTLGQAMGTGTNPSILGLATFQNYQEPDDAAQIARYQAAGFTQEEARRKTASTLARDLDDHPYQGDYNRTGQTTLDNWGGALRGDWTVGPVQLTSVTGFERYWRSRDTDQDFTPQQLFESEAQDDAWEYFQSLQASGELGELPVRWNVGANYLMEDLNFQDTTFTTLQDPTHRVYEQKLWSYSVWGGFSWDFLDDFTLEGGVRWNWDQKDLVDFTVNTGNVKTTPLSDTLIGSSPTGALTLTYRFNEAVSSYWKYSHGWKPGTFNTIAQTCTLDPAGAGCNVTLANPEQIDAWETGLRGTWLDGKLQVGSALFYYKYADYQVFVVADAFLSPPALTIVNANDAQVYGAELDVRYEPLVDLVPAWAEGLVISSKAGWLESEFLDFSTSVTRPGPTPGQQIQVLADYSGNQLINSPRFKMSAVAEWTFDLGRFGALIPRYDFAWTSDISFDPNEGRGSPDVGGATFLPKYGDGQERFWLHNVRLAYRVPEGNIEIAGWCRNLTNKVYKTYSFDATNFANVVINFLGEPRTYGLDFTVRF